MRQSNVMEIIEPLSASPQYRPKTDCRVSMVGFRVTLSSILDPGIVFVRTQLHSAVFRKFFKATWNQ
jgi:hypothetical protein